MSGFTESQNFAILPHELQLASLLHLTSLLDKKDQVHVVPAPGLQRQALEHLSHSKLDEVQTLDTLSHLCSLLSDDTTLVSRAGVLIEPPGRLQRHPSQGDPSDMQLDPPRIHTLQEAWTCGLE